MAVKQDIELRISANDLGTKKLEELQQTIEDLRRSQEAYAASGDVAARSLRELTQELADLKRIGSELSGRGALIDLFEKQSQAVKESSARVEQSRAALEAYKTTLVGVETVTKKQQKELATLEKAFANANKGFTSASGSLEKIRVDLAKLGLEDTDKAKTAIIGMADSISRSLKQGEAAVRTYDEAMRRKRETEKAAAESARQLAEAQRQAARAAAETANKAQFLNLARGALDLVTAARKLQESAGVIKKSGAQFADGLRQISDPARAATQSIEGLGNAVLGLEADLKAAASGNATATENIRRQRTEYAAFARDAQKAAVAVAETIDEFRKASEAVRSTGGALEAARQKVNGFASDIIRVGVPTEELKRKLATARTELAALTAQFSRESALLATLGERLRKAGVDAGSLSTAEAKLLDVTKRLAAAQATLGAGTVRVGQANKQAAAGFLETADKGRKALSIYQRIRGQVLAMTSAYVGLYGVIRFAQAAVQEQIDREATLVRLQVANQGNVRKSAQDFEFLRQQAERLGLVFGPLAANYSRFAISAQSANLSNQQIKDTFLGFAEASRVFNLSVEDTAGVFRALDQILSKGKVQAEELRGQLGDRLSGAFTTFAKALGLSNKELDNLLKKGGVSAQQIVKLATQYRESVADQLDPATKSLQANLARLTNAIDEFQVQVAKGGLSEVIGELATNLTQFLRSAEGAKTAKDIAEAFRAVGNAALFLLKNFELVTAAVKTLFASLALRFIINQVVEFQKWAKAVNGLVRGLEGATVAAKAMSLAMRAAPWGVLLTAITSIVVYLNYWKNRNADLVDSNEALEKAIRDVETATEDQSAAALAALKVKNDEIDANYELARSALAQAIAEEELTKTINKRSPRGEPGEGAVRASIAIDQSNRIKSLQERLKGLEEQAAKARKAIYAALAPKPAESSDGGVQDEPEVDETALKALADKRIQLEQQAVDAIMAARKEALSADKDNIEAQLQLIDLELGERVLKIRELQEQLRAVGLDSTSKALDPLVDSALVIRNIERSEALRNEELERRKALQDQLKKQEEALDKLIEARDRKIEMIQTKRELNLLTERQAQEQTEQTNLDAQQAILDKITEIRAFITGNEADLAEFLNLDEVRSKLDEIELTSTNFATRFTQRVGEIQEQIAGGLTDSILAFGSALGNVIEGTASLGDAFKAAWDTFRSFAADFLREIAQMIIKQMILNALQNAMGSGGFFGQVIGGLAGATSGHTGMVVGHRPGTPRQVPAWMFATAPRYHSGAVAGLRADERPAILQTGEEVLSRRDPRNVMNGGGAPGAMQQIKVINHIDANSFASDVINTPAGVQAIANVIRSNRNTFKTALA